MLNNESDMRPWTRNLCSYFWFVVLNLIVKIPMLILIVALAVALSPIWIPGLGLVFCGCWLYEKYQERDRRLKREAGIPPYADWPEKGPGLLRSWLKAKKEKVCPLIEWEE